jgi:hypothetical protein
LHSSHEKSYPVAKLKRPEQPRRAISKKDFKLPRPYRRQVFSEAPERLSRLQVSLLAFAGVMVVSLLGVLALLAQESERSPDGKIIVVAERATGGKAIADEAITFPPMRTPPVPLLPPMPRAPGMPPQLARPGAGQKPPLHLIKPPRKAAPQRHVLARLPAKAAHARKERATPATVPDPDVALITAILLLTPPPAPPALPSLAPELAGRHPAVCTSIVSSCADLHKMKP